MKIVTSVTIFADAVGMRMSITYSEVDEQTGRVISDNKRIDRVITDKTAKKYGQALEEYAQSFVNMEE